MVEEEVGGGQRGVGRQRDNLCHDRSVEVAGSITAVGGGARAKDESAEEEEDSWGENRHRDQTGAKHNTVELCESANCRLRRRLR